MRNLKPTLNTGRERLVQIHEKLAFLQVNKVNMRI